MSDHNPLGREYSLAEIAASIRLGIARYDKIFDPFPNVRKVLSGPIIWATGDYLPDHARKMADDWALVADAVDREFSKPKEQDT